MGSKQYSAEYLRAIEEQARKKLPPWLFKYLRDAARVQAGGWSSPRKPSTQQETDAQETDGLQPEVDAEQIGKLLEDIGAPRAVQHLAKSGHGGETATMRFADRRYLSSIKPLAGVVVHDVSPEHPDIAFIGASPSDIDALKQVPFACSQGDVMRKYYLDPLDMGVDHVAYGNLVPVHLVTEQGRQRWPEPDEIEEWSESLHKWLDDINPRLVVALGTVARDALGDRADTWAPHPRAIQTMHHETEARRRARQIARLLNEKREAEAVAKEAEAEPSFSAVYKADDEQRLVYGVVLEPNTVDSQLDILTEEEIERAAHNYLVKSRVVGDRHSKKASADVVQSYIALTNFDIGGNAVKKGSWVMVVKIHDDRLWSAVKRGEYTGYSIGGHAKRVPTQQAA